MTLQTCGWWCYCDVVVRDVLLPPAFRGWRCCPTDLAEDGRILWQLERNTPTQPGYFHPMCRHSRANLGAFEGQCGILSLVQVHSAGCWVMSCMSHLVLATRPYQPHNLVVSAWQLRCISLTSNMITQMDDRWPNQLQAGIWCIALKTASKLHQNCIRFFFEICLMILYIFLKNLLIFSKKIFRTWLWWRWPQVKFIKAWLK